MSPIRSFCGQLVLDVSSIVELETQGCVRAVLRTIPLSLVLTFDASVEIDTLGIEIPSDVPFIRLPPVTSSVEAMQMVALAAHSLSNADAASLVSALSQNRALVTNDKRLKAVAEQAAPTLRLFSSSDIIQFWRELSD